MKILSRRSLVAVLTLFCLWFEREALADDSHQAGKVVQQNQSNQLDIKTLRPALDPAKEVTTAGFLEKDANGQLRLNGMLIRASESTFTQGELTPGAFVRLTGTPSAAGLVLRKAIAFPQSGATRSSLLNAQEQEELQRLHFEEFNLENKRFPKPFSPR